MMNDYDHLDWWLITHDVLIKIFSYSFQMMMHDNHRQLLTEMNWLLLVHIVQVHKQVQEIMDVDKSKIFLSKIFQYDSHHYHPMNDDNILNEWRKFSSYDWFYIEVSVWLLIGWKWKCSNMCVAWLTCILRIVLLRIIRIVLHTHVFLIRNRC